MIMGVPIVCQHQAYRFDLGIVIKRVKIQKSKVNTKKIPYPYLVQSTAEAIGKVSFAGR